MAWGNSNVGSLSGGAGGSGVNKNLLTNWYFANPVNRRGGFCFITKGTPCYSDTALTTPEGNVCLETFPVTVENDTYSSFISNSGATWYMSTADVKYGYYKAGDTIDRWRIINSPLTVKLDKKLTLDNSVGTSATYYGQNFEIDLTGRSVTLSVLTSEGLYSGTGVIKNNTSWEIRFSVGEKVEMYYQKGTSGFGVFFVLSAGAILDLIAVKLELGDTQTLAYQDDNGNWQLYEIPNYEEEYAKCVAIEPKVNNDNLLMNWYFKNPVNRKNGYYIPKGSTVYSDTALTTVHSNSIMTDYPVTVNDSTYSTFTSSTGTVLYCKTSDCKKGYVSGGNTIDCWWNRVNMNDTATGVFLTDDGIKYQVLTTSTSALKHRFISQRIENYKNLLGKQVTLSMLIGDSHTSTAIENFFAARVHSSVRIDYHSTQLGTTSWSNKTGLHSITFTIPETITKDHTGLNASIYMRPDANTVSVGDYFVIEAIKLELGNKQTLAHQDKDGNWVLNEIPDYQEMYEQCSVYPVEHDDAYIGNGGFVPTSGNVTMTGPLYAHQSTDYTTYRVRNIAATTATITAGSSSLANGNILLQYE